jgi:uncharacterized protein YceK
MKNILIIITISLFAGCTTLQDASEGKGKGKSESYNYSYDKVWDAAIKVVDESKLDLISKDKEEGKILAQKGMSVFSYGENVAIFVSTKDEENTAVEVVSKRALATNVVAKNWSNYILTKIREMLE